MLIDKSSVILSSYDKTEDVSDISTGCMKINNDIINKRKINRFN